MEGTTRTQLVEYRGMVTELDEWNYFHVTINLNYFRIIHIIELHIVYNL